MLLANTYHLALRPGEDEVAALGGLHSFMGWDGPILTDSGGFQVFSLSDRNRVTDQRRDLSISPRRTAAGADARASHGDPGSARGRRGHVPGPLPAACRPRKMRSPTPLRRTIAWAARCKAAHTRADQALFGIVQGGPHADLRAECAEALIALDFDGYAVGGVSVGEGRELDPPGPRRHNPPSAAPIGRAI